MNEFEFIPVTKLPSGLMLPEDSVACEDEITRDCEYLKKLYPAKARLIMALVEDRCDRMEYEGSPMFCDYPDKETFLGIAREIYDRIAGEDNALSGGKGSSGHSDSTLRQLIEVLVFNECMIRRSRYRRRRRYF